MSISSHHRGALAAASCFALAAALGCAPAGAQEYGAAVRYGEPYRAPAGYPAPSYAGRRPLDYSLKDSPPPRYEPAAPSRPLVTGDVPDDEKVGYDVHTVIDGLLDAESFFELKPLFAPELVVGLGLLEGKPVGVVANNPAQKGGVLFVDSADKATRFITTCNAFNIPLLFLADVPGFMIGTQVERQGIIRHGAKMISAVCEATVPKISVIVRKAYGAGLYAMAGPAFGADAVLALSSASIAVMGPQAAINAVFANQLSAIEDDAERAAKTEELRATYAEDIDILHLGSELIVDAVIEPDALRDELVRRFAQTRGRPRDWPAKHCAVTPV